MFSERPSFIRFDLGLTIDPYNNQIVRFFLEAAFFQHISAFVIYFLLTIISNQCAIIDRYFFLKKLGPINIYCGFRAKLMVSMA